MTRTNQRTIRLTVAQATVEFLAAQFSERDGERRKLFAGCFGIFGHGNVAGVGQALLQHETQVEGAARGLPVAGSGDPMGYQRVYGTTERPIDVFAEVRTGDVVLVPHGWHGPSMAAPGYDLYYLNVMAGPGAQRAWLICDDPSHGWVRQTWAGLAVDPRLPLGGKHA